MFALVLFCCALESQWSRITSEKWSPIDNVTSKKKKKKKKNPIHILPSAVLQFAVKSTKRMSGLSKLRF